MLVLQSSFSNIFVQAIFLLVCANFKKVKILKNASQTRDPNKGFCVLVASGVHENVVNFSGFHRCICCLCNYVLCLFLVIWMKNLCGNNLVIFVVTFSYFVFLRLMGRDSIMLINVEVLTMRIACNNVLYLVLVLVNTLQRFCGSSNNIYYDCVFLWLSFR